MLLHDFLNIDVLDLDFITNYYKVIADYFDCSAFDPLPYGQINANTVLYEIFRCINNTVFNNIKTRDFPCKIKRKIWELCEQRVNEFSPSINCIASRFQNELDEVAIEHRSVNEIAGAVCLLLTTS